MISNIYYIFSSYILRSLRDRTERSRFILIFCKGHYSYYFCFCTVNTDFSLEGLVPLHIIQQYVKYGYTIVLYIVLNIWKIIGPFIRGKIRRILNKTRTVPFIRACLI